MNTVLIIDYKVGNNKSVINSLAFLGYKFLISNKKKDIAEANAYILPGVGAFNEAMKNIQKLDILDVLSHQVLVNKKPILGICLGMQVLADSSEENGFHKGLGWIKGKVKRLKAKKDIRIPHVGWNSIHIVKKTPLFEKNKENSDFYFDHSYSFVCEKSYVSAECLYGNKIVAAVQKDNIFGVQFHHEKSQNNGLKLFRSFFKYIEKNA